MKKAKQYSSAQEGAKINADGGDLGYWLFASYNKNM